METEHTPRLSYGIRQACEATGLGRSFIYQAIADGRLQAFKAGSRTLIASDALASWLSTYQKKAA